MAELSWDSVMDALNTNNVPEICLLLMGVVALVIVGYYRSDKDSGLYKAMVAVGVITGIFLVVVAVMAETSWSKGTLLVVTVASFALITRPIKDVNIAAIIGLVVAIWVYLILPDAVSDLNSPFEFLEVLGEGIPRIIVAVVAHHWRKKRGELPALRRVWWLLLLAAAFEIASDAGAVFVPALERLYIPKLICLLAIVFCFVRYAGDTGEKH